VYRATETEIELLLVGKRNDDEIYKQLKTQNVRIDSMCAGCGMGGGNAVLSDVGRDRTPGIQSLAKRRSGYTGRKTSVCLMIPSRPTL